MSRLVLAFLFLGLALAFDPSLYPNKAIINSNYTFYWKVDADKENIQFGLVVSSLGWVGFGLGEITSGSMPGGDIAVISYSGNKPVITDYYATHFAFPNVDDCQSWNLLTHEIDGDLTLIEISRAIDTEDSQDRVILAGKNIVLYAYGKDTEMALTYHESRRGSFIVNFWASEVEPPPPTDARIKTFDLSMEDFKVPRRTTTYACHAVHIPVDRTDGDHHIVMIEPLMDPRSTRVTHHMLVHMCVNNGLLSYASLFKIPGECLSPIGIPFSGCSSLLYAWAMGVGSMTLPAEAGYRMGYGKGTFQYIVIEMHFDNPDDFSGIVDSSGVRIHYTDALRKYDAGSMTLGDPYISFPDILPGIERHPVEATCPSQCTETFSHDINVFASGLHMHASGRQMWTTHYRDDVLLSTTDRADFYSFDFQHVNYVNYTIKRGDRLNTHCVMSTADRNYVTRFGYASIAEMCMNFISYWPRLEFNGQDFAYCGYFGHLAFPYTHCGSNQGLITMASVMLVWNPSVSDLEETMEISFGQPPGSCAAKKN